MKNYLIIAFLFVVLIAGCKEDKKSKADPPISALSIIKGQLQHLDTSLYQITKIETTREGSDSIILKREDIRKYAAPFLSLPEIANGKYYKDYKEERFIDQEQGTLSITAFANDENAEIQKQILIISLADLTNGKVKSIYIDRQRTDGDILVEEKLFWEIDTYFSIGSIVQKQNNPEETKLVKIEWK
jgi:hypothetical protein